MLGGIEAREPMNLIRDLTDYESAARAEAIDSHGDIPLSGARSLVSIEDRLEFVGIEIAEQFPVDHHRGRMVARPEACVGK